VLKVLKIEVSNFRTGYFQCSGIFALEPLRVILIANIPWWKKGTNTFKICKKYHCHQPIKIQHFNIRWNYNHKPLGEWLKF
jgi:hypothetical protein